MNYLILSAQATEPYAKLISHELWSLVRPRCVVDKESSQLWTGVWSHDGRFAIGELDGSQPIHEDADEFALAALIGPAITDEEEAFIIQTIVDAKGGSLNVLEMLQSIDSLSPNLRSREQLEAEGWFTTEEA